MKALQQRTGMAMLFITHDFGVVAQIADRLAVMKQGVIVESGTARRLINAPTHEYTRKLLASLPENLQRQKSVNDSLHRGSDAALLELKGLQVYFPIKKGVMRRTVDHVKAVDGIDLTIPQGQILALVGESGCGKSTLGRAILRLTEPTAGQIHFNGQEITALQRREMQPLRREMQIIFQDPMSSLNPRLSIAATLTEPMKVHGIGESNEERLALAQTLLERVQMKGEHLWRYPHEFSGGQRQRIGIARALALSPKFIVCDEVTSALDVSVQAEILQMLLELRRERDLTLLFITHNIGVVEYVSDEMAVMHNGRIVEQGPTDRVSRAPQHNYTQKLLAAVPRIDFGLQR